MFFNNCCRRPCCRYERNNKQEKNYCDITDKYDYDKCNQKEKCECDKKEKCCYHINFEKKCCYDKDDDKCFDKNDNNSYYQSDRRFEGQGYYCEYNNLGSFGHDDKECDYKQDRRNSYDKEDERKDYNNGNRRESYNDNNDFDYKTSYTPNWENDRDCKCEKDNRDKCDKNEWNNKCCKPVKYICIPFDKY